MMNKITDANGAANDEFGLSVSISGNYAIVGAPYDDVGANTNKALPVFISSMVELGLMNNIQIPMVLQIMNLALVCLSLEIMLL
ncbi:MAG: FG-GAP repeat protein [Saprospiraceae bacterium]|nr:FG-GAP repeat protein [Saprospiraceae bacterium]